MKFLPFQRTGLHLLLGLTAWAGLPQRAAAQVPTAELLRAQHKSVAPVAAYATPGGSAHLDGELQRLGARATDISSRGAAPTAAVLRAAHPGLRFSKGNGPVAVLVRITAQDVAALLPSLLGRGFVVTASYPALHFVEGMLPVSQLAAGSSGVEALAGSGLLGVMASFEPESNGGLVTSQADYVLEAARAPRHPAQARDGQRHQHRGDERLV